MIVFPVVLSPLSLAVGLSSLCQRWSCLVDILCVGSVVLGTPWLSHLLFVFLSWCGHGHVLVGGHVVLAHGGRTCVLSLCVDTVTSLD